MKVFVDARYVCHHQTTDTSSNLFDAACQMKVKCALQAVCYTQQALPHGMAQPTLRTSIHCCHHLYM